jgi:dolichol-phosphate mannosyltransferase
LCSGYWHVFDPQNGFVAIHREFLSALELNRLRKSRYFFENEMLIQLNIMAARVMDRPIPSVYGNEASSLHIFDILLYYPFSLFRGFFHRTYHRYILRDFSIIVPLYLAGFTMFMFGVIFGAYNWYHFSIVVKQPAPAGTIVLAVLPLILGFQMLTQGLLIDILQSPKADSVLKRR